MAGFAGPDCEIHRRRALRSAAAVALAVAALAGGCGGEDESRSAVAGTTEAGAGGSLAWAVGHPFAGLDPLFAANETEELASRQIHEPLVEALSGPFDDPRRVPGLALGAEPSDNATEWRVRLRSGVRFQDGTPFNAGVVVANAERWQRFPELSGLPPEPELFVFAPKPDQVTFKLARPEPEFDRRLADPHLGIVSPAALERASRGELGLASVTDSGTGPFELRERSADRLLLAPNADWWGSGRALGPAIDQLEFVFEAFEAERVALLRAGEVQVTGGLRAMGEEAVAADPLLTVIGRGLGAERSVRGIPDERVPPLNGVWQTRIDGG